MQHWRQSIMRVTLREGNERARRLNSTVAVLAFSLAVTLLSIEKNYPAALLSLWAVLLVEIHEVDAAAGDLTDFKPTRLPPEQRDFWTDFRSSYFTFGAGVRRSWTFVAAMVLLGVAALRHSV